MISALPIVVVVTVTEGFPEAGLMLPCRDSVSFLERILTPSLQ